MDFCLVNLSFKDIPNLKKNQITFLAGFLDKFSPLIISNQASFAKIKLFFQVMIREILKITENIPAVQTSTLLNTENKKLSANLSSRIQRRS